MKLDDAADDGVHLFIALRGAENVCAVALVRVHEVLLVEAYAIQCEVSILRSADKDCSADVEGSARDERLVRCSSRMLHVSVYCTCTRTAE